MCLLPPLLHLSQASRRGRVSRLSTASDPSMICAVDGSAVTPSALKVLETPEIEALPSPAAQRLTASTGCRMLGDSVAVRRTTEDYGLDLHVTGVE